MPATSSSPAGATPGLATLSVIFFLSGQAALVFETLWFREAGLTFGNTVWATAIVTASFMAGLAAGSATVARYGRRLRHPLLAYSGLEALIGVSGLLLVLAFPRLTPTLMPLFRRWIATPTAVTAARLVLAFLVFALPATAMGATLPLLTQALRARPFGHVLGQLYGWNTLGAVAGAVISEAFLIARFGLRAAALAAALMNGVAAGGAWWAARRLGPDPISTEALLDTRHLSAHARRLLAAAFVSGGLLLGLEVLWFRLLILYIDATNLVFAILLGVVLGGIAVGGLLASWWVRWRPDATHAIPAVALLAGASCAVTYGRFGDTLYAYRRTLIVAEPTIAWVAARLMTPTCVLSGVLFTLIGAALKSELGENVRAAGALTVANTVGAAAGSLLAGFLLLPRLGLERSIAITSVAYAVVAWLTFRRADLQAAGRSARTIQAAVLALFLLVIALFPFGLMPRRYIPMAVGRWMGDGSHVVAVREGLSETVAYLRKDFLGEPLSFRLVTNSISMAGSGFAGQRYMRLFAWLPLALRPQSEEALLISYGVGTTARTLVDTRTIRSIDVVDPSRDILQLGRLVYPSGYPLDDSRVKVHVEDGRFFLNTTAHRYDIVTSEPPPPKSAGIVSLYSLEYFRLIHEHLKPGGVASYWLPVYQLEPGDFKAITRAFCRAFGDCSLWTGFGPEWMLVGSRSGAEGVEKDPVEKGPAWLWRDPSTASTLAALGLEVPEQLGTLFIADAPTLDQWTRDVAPLEDDHPYRLSARRAAPHADFYSSIAATGLCRQRFLDSTFIRQQWPPALRERTADYFAAQAVINRYAWSAYAPGETGFPEARELLERSSLRTPVLWLLGSSAAEQEIAERQARSGADDPSVDTHLAIRAIAEHRFHEALGLIERARQHGGAPERLDALRALAADFDRPAGR